MVEDTDPQCVAFILDGNRRWEEQNGLSYGVGHAAGYSKMKDAVCWVKNQNIPCAIVYGLSIENLGRSEKEVKGLFELARYACSSPEVGYFIREGVRVSFIGNMRRLPNDVSKKMRSAERKTRSGNKAHLIIAVAYSGRDEILNAIKRAAKTEGAKEFVKLTEASFEEYLWTRQIGVPHPDLVIRTGGEMRVSNFLLWQISYAELFFTPTLWPDFSEEDFIRILSSYKKRERKYGK